MTTDSEILKAKILIVDDQPSNVKLLEQTLRSAGYSSIQSTTLPESVCDLYRENRYDLIMLDIQMPGMDGFEVMARLKEIETGGYLPVLVLTAQPDHKLQALKAGARDFLSKPFDLAEVLLRVRNMIEVRLLHKETKRLYEEIFEEQRVSARLKPIFRYGPAVVAISTVAEGRIIDVNEEYCRFFGYSRAELIGNCVTDLHFWTTPEERREVMARLLKERAIRGLKLQQRNRSGDVRTVLASLELIDSHGEEEAALIFMSTDITDREDSERKLRESEIRYRRLFEAARDGVLLLNAETGMIEDVNPFLIELLGIPREDFLQKKIWDLGNFQHVIANKEKFAELLQNEYVRYADLPLETVDGRQIDVEFVSNVYEENGVKVIQCNIRSLTESKRLAVELRETHEELRRVLEHSPAVIYSVQVQESKWQLHLVSENITRVTGYTPQECNYELWADGVHPDDLERAIASMPETIARGSLTLQYRVRHKNGKYIWVEDSRTVMHGSGDGAVEIFGAWVDITERKKAEEVVAQSERRLSEMLENLELIAVKLDDNGKILFCNEYLLRMTGRSREETIGANWFEMFIPVTNANRELRYTDSIKIDSIPSHFEDTIITKSGEVRDIIWNNTALRDYAGKITGTARIGENVSGRRQAELKLRQEEENYRDLLENANDLILNITPDGELLYANRAWHETLGYKVADLSEFALLDLIPPDRREHAVDVFKHAAEGQKVPLFETVFISKAGDQIAVEGSISIKSLNGKITSLRCIFRDITEKKQTEAHMLRNQRMESLGTLAGGIAHDLNNMLTPILIAIEVLRPNIESENGLKVLDVLERSAKHGADMVRQVLAFAKGIDGEKAEVSIKHLIKEITTVVQHTFPKSISLHTEVANDLWTIIGDATQLHQALLNLCVNARDAMPNGGNLAINVENVTLDEHYAQMNTEARAGQYVVFSVTDTGSGIPLHVREKIFDPYFTTKPLDQGTGLGLATVRGILKGHDGFISVYSEVGKGTEFKLYFPALLVAGAPFQQPKELALPMGHGESILVVDDEPSILNITKQCLEKFGYRVFTADDGAQAIALCAQFRGKIDVLLTDMMMPIMDGPATIRAALSLDPDIKVIAASGLGIDMNNRMKDMPGPIAFLQKPYTAERLLTAVADVLKNGIASRFSHALGQDVPG